MKQAKTLEFKSGDCLIFNGGTEYNVMHGINEIVCGTAPDFFPEGWSEQRLSVQFRATERNDNKPYFKKY